jgi:Dehydrogenases with different specificities (related to short-chain alcohol dehydrogenases)
MIEAFDLSRRVAIVTGGANGIGREIVRVLAAAGATVVVADLDGEAAAKAAHEETANGRLAVGLAVDVTHSEDARVMVSRVLAELGRIDILVNNAGICINVPAEDADDEAWRRVLDVNLDGTYWCSREVGRAMLVTGRGSIVNIASMSGLVVNWPQPQAAYNASKAAVIQLTKSLASEWAARGIRVNSVSPGYIGTEMTKRGMSTPGWGETWLDRSPMGRLGTPIDVAYAVLYLASDAAAFATGTNLVVDGGYSIW